MHWIEVHWILVYYTAVLHILSSKFDVIEPVQLSQTTLLSQVLQYETDPKRSVCDAVSKMPTKTK